jgi:hypothetical protein
MRQIQLQLRRRPLRTLTRRNPQTLDLRTPSGRPLPF